MSVDLRSEKIKREERDRKFDEIVSGMTAFLIISLVIIVLYTLFWSML